VKREAFVCPFCGAPQSDTLSSTVAEARCRYCGSLIPVPRQLVALSRRCPNHPEAMTAGVCGICGRAFCDQCLRVLTWAGEKRYLCLECSESQMRVARSENKCVVAIGIVTVSVGFSVMVFLSYHSWYHDYMDYVGLFSLLGTFILTGFICLCAGGFTNWQLDSMSRIQNEEEELEKTSAGTYFAYAKCPYCNAGYSYNLSRIGPDHRVTCQNCNRSFEIRTVLDM
jgi:predicted Zn finger-like uncharacterized protein